MTTEGIPLHAAQYTEEVGDSECLFCRIVAGEIPGQMVHRDETVVAFDDIAPVAPTHVVIVPVDHHENAADLARADPATAAHLITIGHQLAVERGLNGYRLVFNTGADAGQTVPHAHLHLLGGRSMTWPPG